MLRLSDFARTALRMLTWRRVAIAEFPNSPLLLALLWIAATAVNVVHALLLPGEGYTPPSSVLYRAGCLLLAALVAAGLIGRRTDAIRLGIAFMLLGLVMSVARLGLEALALPGEHTERFCMLGLGLWVLLAAAFLLRKGWGHSGSQRGSVAAAAFFGFILVFSGKVASFDGYLMSLSPAFAASETDDPDYAPIDHEVLWPAQPALVEAAVASLRGRGHTQPRTQVLAVAAGGSQQLFGREAHAVLALLTRRLGQDTHGALLSNARADLAQVPLATTANLAAVLRGAGQDFDSRLDLMVIYLTAHGSRDAELGTDLPDYADLKRISAEGLAKSLDAAGIKRRIVIVSACFSGTWIRPLASPDTIVLTAAAADRTSFGCDDTREFTVFGEALINGSLGRGASLRDAFADLKRRVAREESAEGATPSLPQAYVGAHMQDLWSAKAAAAAQ